MRESLTTLIAEYGQLKSQQDSIKFRMSEISESIKLDVGVGNKLETDQAKISYSKVKTSRFNSKQFKLDDPDQYANYCVESESERLSIKLK